MPSTASDVAATVVLAHQGGWDEILFVAVPLAVFAVLLAVANARAKRRAVDRDGGPRAGDSSSPS